MSILTFKGGIHPYEGKELSKDKEITEYLPKGDVAISMAQHIGAPATPLVKKGDKVLVGQLIGEAKGFISANIHSSVSGTVKAVENRLMVNGMKSECVVIENDGLFEEVEYEKVDKQSKEKKKKAKSKKEDEIYEDSEEQMQNVDNELKSKEKENKKKSKWKEKGANNN